MRLGSALALAVMLAVVGCASSQRGTDVFESEGRPAGAADRAFLPGVPYVSWNEAARLWFRERDLTNPSFHASFLMVLGYWGQHWSLMDDRTALQEWGITDKGTAPSLASVKSFLHSGVPAIVPGALTPPAPFADPAGVRDREAADRLLQALARADISVGYRHLLRLELAGYEMHRGRLRAAADSADEAARLVPESPAPWSVAAEAYRRLGRAQDADAAAARARQLAACSEGAQVRGHGEVKVLPETLYRPEHRALASVIARDFFVVASCPDAGVTWLLRPLP